MRHQLMKTMTEVLTKAFASYIISKDTITPERWEARTQLTWEHVTRVEVLHNLFMHALYMPVMLVSELLLPDDYRGTYTLEDGVYILRAANDLDRTIYMNEFIHNSIFLEVSSDLLLSIDTMKILHQVMKTKTEYSCIPDSTKWYMIYSS
jgi:hypothetical protein